jgi:hypothetical protein
MLVGITGKINQKRIVNDRLGTGTDRTSAHFARAAACITAAPQRRNAFRCRSSEKLKFHGRKSFLSQKISMQNSDLQNRCYYVYFTAYLRKLQEVFRIYPQIQIKIPLCTENHTKR